MVIVMILMQITFSVLVMIGKRIVDVVLFDG